MLFIYRFFFPLIFLFFLPGLIVKLIRRGGWKKTYMERFGFFSAERKIELKEWRGAIWIHAVSVGETNVALTLLNEWNRTNPGRRFVLSTTTTTGQEIARNKAPENVKVIFCPVDSTFAVCRTLNLLQPSALVILETELWPNLLLTAKKRGIPLVLVNSRISDKSFGGYRRFRCFFAPILNAFDRICAQTETDRERLEIISETLKEKKTVEVCGNIKFDQKTPAGQGFDYESFFGRKAVVILSSSTHDPEEDLHLKAYCRIHQEFPDTALAIVPRHAERGGDLEKLIRSYGLSCFRRSNGTGTAQPDVLLADTTGELPGFIKGADIILMGKTMAGNDEGQNIIEPAIMGKAIICGPKLKNFRQAQDLLFKEDAVLHLKDDTELENAMRTLVADAEKRTNLGKRAQNAMAKSSGALLRNIQQLEAVISR